MPLIFVNATLPAQDREGTGKTILMRRNIFHSRVKWFIKIDVSRLCSVMPNSFLSEEPCVEPEKVGVGVGWCRENVYVYSRKTKESNRKMQTSDLSFGEIVLFRMWKMIPLVRCAISFPSFTDHIKWYFYCVFRTPWWYSIAPNAYLPI